MISNGVVMSQLTYLITLLGGASQYLINGLQVQQLAAETLISLKIGRQITIRLGTP